LKVHIYRSGKETTVIGSQRIEILPPPGDRLILAIYQETQCVEVEIATSEVIRVLDQIPTAFFEPYLRQRQQAAAQQPALPPELHLAHDSADADAVGNITVVPDGCDQPWVYDPALAQGGAL